MASLYITTQYDPFAVEQFDYPAGGKALSTINIANGGNGRRELTP
jgi:hypothetical protein